MNSIYDKRLALAKSAAAKLGEELSRLLPGVAVNCHVDDCDMAYITHCVWVSVPAMERSSPLDGLKAKVGRALCRAKPKCAQLLPAAGCRRFIWCLRSDPRQKLRTVDGVRKFHHYDCCEWVYRLTLQA